jgi:hypothetical protein
MEEKKLVQRALRQLGFVGLGPWDWIYQTRETVCAIPDDELSSFQSAIRFLREGTFQVTLQKQTRLAYYHLAEALDAIFHGVLSAKKDDHERTIRRKHYQAT